jgi:histidinol dehydrogenase
MRVTRLEWKGAQATGAMLRIGAAGDLGPIDVEPIRRDVRTRRDEALREMTQRFDLAGGASSWSLRVPAADPPAALAGLDRSVREAMEVAVTNVRAVAEAQLDSESREVELPQGQTVRTREVPVLSAGIYAPGGRAAYPSSVLMCAVPARVAGVQRLALASPPQRDGSVNPLVLAAAALCEIDEVYAVGGAQAIFALAYGTETVGPVQVIAGPGNAWVREAKRAVYGAVGIDSLAGPSELMLIAGEDVDPEWAALDLCAQAEHGYESPLVAVATDSGTLDAIAAAAERIAGERPSVQAAPLALVLAPSLADAVDLANVFAPEHLELLGEEVAALAAEATTAGCVFAGNCSATAFGDYVAGSNHVLPTAGAGAFSGPLGPAAFRRRIAVVQVPPDAVAKLAPHVEALAEAEGFPVHGESAMIRAEEKRR